MGIFADFGPKYFEAGYNVMPVDGKRGIETGFQRWSKERMTEEEFLRLEKRFPNANIGLVLGFNNLVAFDFDYNGPGFEILEAGIREIIPEMVCAKFGSKGITSFYRSSLPGRKITERVGNEKINVFEILSTGNFTVVPPSTHPDTRRPYLWVVSDLMDFKIEDLPELTESHLERLKSFVSNFFSEELNKYQDESTGRNNYLKGYAFAVAEKCGSIHELTEKLINKDREKFGGNSYFNDSKENRGRPALEFAKDMAERVVRKIAEIKLQTGKVWSLENPGEKEELIYPRDMEKIAAKYPAVKTGFSYIEDDGNGKKRVCLYREFSEYFRDVFGFTIYNQSNHAVFNGKYFDFYGVDQIKHIISKHIFQEATPNYVDNYFKRIKLDGQSLNDFPLPDDSNGLINLKNGIYDIKNKSMIAHSKKYFFRQCFDFDYDPNAKCDKWLEFLDDIFGGDKEIISALQNIFGYVLLGGRPFLQKAFIFTGGGRNGKGVVLSVLKSLIGNNSFSTISMENLNKPFSAVQLYGKLANIVEESPREVNSEAFKNIVGGGHVTAAYKGKDEFQFMCNARLVFACNDLPKFDDKNVSILDRLFIIPFNKYYAEGVNMDPMLQGKILSELTGILSWAIAGADAVLESRFITQPASVIAMKEEFRQENDPAYSWFQECVKIEGIPSEARKKSVDDIYLGYKLWCDANGHRYLNKNTFCKRLAKMCRQATNLGCEVKIGRDASGKVRRYYDQLSVSKVYLHTELWSQNQEIRYDDEH